jgi:hypothetical protein
MPRAPEWDPARLLPVRAPARAIRRTTSNEGTIVNTTLTATRSTAQQAEAVRAGAGRLQERLARRAGLALLAWSLAAEARRLREDAELRRRAELQREADRLRESNFTAVALARTL